MAYLIIGGSNQQQERELNQICQNQAIGLDQNNPDRLEVKPDKTIGIDQIRQIKTFLSKKSWRGQKQKAVIVHQAETMTTPAQNAFLKTLEEPPPNSIIILIAANNNALLPTIVSRCQTIYLSTTSKIDKKIADKYWQKWDELANSKLDKKLKLAQKIDTEDLDKFILTLQQKLVSGFQNKFQIKNWLETLLTAKQMANDYVKFSRVVDWLVLKI